MKLTVTILARLSAGIQRIRQYTARQYIIRLLTALMTVWLLVYWMSGVSFTEPAFYNTVPFALFLCFTSLLWTLLCFIPSDTVITAALLMVTTLCFSNAAYQTQDYLFSFGLCFVLCVMVLFSNIHIRKSLSGWHGMWWICLLLILLFTVFVGGICCLYYNNYQTPCYDFGLFSQMFYYMKETGQDLTTCERDGLLSHFAVHVSPIYYLLLPIYALIPSPCTLLVAQALIVVSGVIPLVFICRHYNLSPLAAILFSVCYTLYPSFMGGCFWYLHENCFLAPLLLWYLYFSEKGAGFKTVLFALLTLCVKEDAAVYVAVVSLYFIFVRKNYKCNLLVLGLSVVYFTVVTHLMAVYGEGVMSNSRYGDYIYDGGGLFTVIKAVIQNPVYVIRQVFDEKKWLFILQMLVPVCFLPLAIKRPTKLILLIPFILVNLMTSYPYQYDIGFQYTFGSGSILLYLAVTNYADMGIRRTKLLLCAVLSSVIIFSGGYFQKTGYIYTYQSTAKQRQTITSALSLIPDDASVASSTFLLANLSQRGEIYELETTRHKAEYIVLDLRYSRNEYTIEEYWNGAYVPVFYEEDTIAVFKRR